MKRDCNQRRRSVKEGYRIKDAAEETEVPVQEAKQAWTDARRDFRDNRGRHRQRSGAVKVRFQAAQSRQSVSTSQR